MTMETCMSCIHRRPVYIARHDNTGPVDFIHYTDEIEGWACGNKQSPEYQAYVDGPDDGCDLHKAAPQEPQP